MNRTCPRAFTLIELLVTIAVLGTLIGVAAPSFSSLIERNQQTTTTHDLLTALSHARGLAINRRQLVSLCSGVDSCEESANWENAILIFSDTNRNGQFDPGEQLHRVVTLPNRYRWNWNNFRSRTFMSFKANGTTNSLNGTYTLCSGSEAIQQVVINITGRLRTRSPEDNSACS